MVATSNAATPVTDPAAVPLLTCDVWEVPVRVTAVHVPFPVRNHVPFPDAASVTALPNVRGQIDWVVVKYN